MSIRFLAAATALLVMGAPAAAHSEMISAEQAGGSYSTHRDSDRSDHVAPQQRGPTARQLNRREARYANSRARERAQIRRDRQAYRAAVMRSNRQARSRYNRRYVRQELAYSRAMAAWRRQVSACHHGSRRACNAPTPRVADFY